MAYSKEDIIQQLKELKPILQKKYPISELALFGSYARGDNNETSDIDILVDFDGVIGLGFFQLANELEDALGNKVDLVSKNGIKPHYLPYLEESMIQI
ncbi:MAG TPA: nucleotidyltransferase family protein [Cyclobacteriaceae bacterium]|nr:nucleotidyltransferase family protein [Cyclobacteriaceae bacterium]